MEHPEGIALMFDGSLGVPLNSSELAPETLALAGDWYREPDDVTRGIALTGSSYGFEPFGGVDAFAGSWETLKEKEAPLSITSVQEKVRRFQDLKEGRRVPTDPFFYLEKTTQYLPTMAPSDAGNSVLEFLQQEEIPSRVFKVNVEKFTIKAEAFHGNLSCQLKVYIWQQEPGCAVEFQRRGGDSIAFAGIYQKAVNYLCEHKVSPGLQKSLNFSVDTNSADYPADDLEELLKISREASFQQDEVASVILGALEHGKTQNLKLWCKQENFKVLTDLLSSNRFTSAYPAARLLTRLVELPEAKQLLLNHNFLKSIIEQVWEQAVGAAVWLELARVIHGVAVRYADAMARRQEIAVAISTAMNLEPCGHSSSSERAPLVRQTLREALRIVTGDYTL